MKPDVSAAYPELAALFLGEYIGGGIARHVFAYRPRPEEYVVKIELGEDLDFQNIAEWQMYWSAAPSLRRWLAPCSDLSPNGRVLIQHRCEPCPTHMIPKRMPKVLADTHDGNFGILNGKVVLHDYGRNNLHKLTANGKSMRTRSW